MPETQPMSYMSSGPGSSLAADFCATSRIDLPASMAVSIALIDLGRPTNSGITMCGNTTTSRSGSSGYCWMAGVSFISGMCGFPQRNQWGERTRSPCVPQRGKSKETYRLRG
jgi:hypothetical protein